MTTRPRVRPAMTAALLTAAVAAAGAPGPARGQTDFYNLDKDRPLRVEDAYATKRYAFELKVAPLTLSQAGDGTVRYRSHFEIKHGILSGLDLSAGVTAGADRTTADGTERSDTEFEVSSLLNLTTETRWLPALGLRVTGHLPVEGDHGSTLEVRGIATRSLVGPVRAHVNGGWTAGDDALERWWAGVALDYVLPFRHLLLLAETYVADPVRTEDLVGAPPPADGPAGASTSRRVHSTAGLRYQVSPVLAMDAGAGRTWSGTAGADWLLTLGITYEFGVRALIPAARR